MLYIDDNSFEVKKAKCEHFDIVSKYLKKHLKTEIGRFIFLNNNIERLIIGRPNELLKINDEFYKYISGYSLSGYNNYLTIKDIHPERRNQFQEKIITRFEELHKIIATIINYDKWFIKSSSLKPDYKLASNLNRNTCTYCNRIYTYTIQSLDDSKIMRPQFDHWFPKSKYPLLALSFYNLIPSCSLCNSSIKGDSNFTIVDYIHPYIDNVTSKFSFSYIYFKDINQFKVRIRTNETKIYRTLKAFKIEEIYTSHQDELADLIKTKKAYSDKYLDILKKAFPKANLSDEEIYRLAFGVEKSETRYHKKPLSKFKKDVLLKLELI